MSSENDIGVYPPPPGVTPNFDHPSESMSTNIILSAVLPPFFASLFIVLRLYTAKVIIKRIRADDCKWMVQVLWGNTERVFSFDRNRASKTARFKPYMRSFSYAGLVFCDYLFYIADNS